MSSNKLHNSASAILDSIAALGIEISVENQRKIERDIENVLYSHGRAVKHECAMAVNHVLISKTTQTGIMREELLVSNAYRHAEQAVMNVEIDS